MNYSKLKEIMMYLRLIFLGLFISWSGQAVSSQAFFTAQIKVILVDSINYGGCMALLSPGPEQTLPNCGAAWVTFSCTGDFNTKSVGNSKLQMAQLAKVSNLSVGVQVDDAKMHNGYCFAQRIDVF